MKEKNIFIVFLPNVSRALAIICLITDVTGSILLTHLNACCWAEQLLLSSLLSPDTTAMCYSLSLWKADCMFCLYFFYSTRRARVLVAERSYLSLRGRKRVPQFLQQKFHYFSLPILVWNLLGQNVQHIISILLFSNTYLQ